MAVSSVRGAWWNMVARCTKPGSTAYEEYGGRGIQVCPRWLVFENFLADMGPRPTKGHSLDRLDVDGPYEPSNCRWATRREQARNTRATKHVTFQGETLSVAGWAERLGVPWHMISNRLKAGWPLERVFGPWVPKPRNPSAIKPSLARSTEYRAWDAMKQRCLNPKHPAWPDYGGRGITISALWQEGFEAFIADMGLRPSPQHSLDRINVEGPYSPENCRWATRAQQARNTRRCLRLTSGGITRTLAEWSEHLGIPSERIRSRLRCGWSVDRALTVKIGPKNRMITEEAVHPERKRAYSVGARWTIGKPPKCPRAGSQGSRGPWAVPESGLGLFPSPPPRPPPPFAFGPSCPRVSNFVARWTRNPKVPWEPLAPDFVAPDHFLAKRKIPIGTFFRSNHYNSRHGRQHRQGKLDVRAPLSPAFRYQGQWRGGVRFPGSSRPRAWEATEGFRCTVSNAQLPSSAALHLDGSSTWLAAPHGGSDLPWRRSRGSCP